MENSALSPSILNSNQPPMVKSETKPLSEQEQRIDALKEGIIHPPVVPSLQNKISAMPTTLNSSLVVKVENAAVPLLTHNPSNVEKNVQNCPLSQHQLEIHQRPANHQIGQQNSEDIQFEHYSDLLDNLNQPKHLHKLIQSKDGPIKLQKRQKRRFLFFFRSGRSKETQRAMGTILGKLEMEIRKAAQKGVDDPTYLKNNGTKVPLKKLYRDFLQSHYGQNVLKHSPHLAKQVASFYLEELGQLDPDRSQEMQQTLNKLNTARRFSGSSFSKFIRQLNQEIAGAKLQQLKQQPIIESAPLSMSEIKDFNKKQLTLLLGELLNTEKTFVNYLKLFVPENPDPSFFDQLVEKKVISNAEREKLNDTWKSLIDESEKFIKAFDQPKELAEKIALFEQVYAPNAINSYYQAFIEAAPLISSLLSKITKFENSTVGKQLSDSLKTRARTLRSDPGSGLQNLDFSPQSPNSIFSMPIQRLPRLELFMNDLKKDLPPSSKRDQNLEFLKKSLVLFNEKTV